MCTLLLPQVLPLVLLHSESPGCHGAAQHVCMCSYRNRMSFMLASPGGDNVLALQQAGSNTAVPVKECLLQHEAANTILQRVNAALQAHSKFLSLYNTKSQSGFLKRVVFRQGRRKALLPDTITSSHSLLDVPDEMKSVDQHILINFVTHGRGNHDQRDALAAVAQMMYQTHGYTSGGQFMVTGVMQSVHVHRDMGAPPKHTENLDGHSFVYEDINTVRYRISANSFFQVNSEQSPELFRAVGIAAKLRSSDVVLDLYCGTGAIALQLAGQCSHVLGVDQVQSSIHDARVNAHLNGTTNTRFTVADLSGRTARDRRVLAELDSAEPSVIILDPGRSGLSDTVKELVMRHKHAERVVYVSCNSEKLTRDIKVVCASGRWHCISVQPVDMFPQTDHLEVVAVLERSA